jgi:hypothetical protein
MMHFPRDRSAGRDLCVEMDMVMRAVRSFLPHLKIYPVLRTRRSRHFEIGSKSRPRCGGLEADLLQQGAQHPGGFLVHRKTVRQ